jgi:hypothetical protein
MTIDPTNVTGRQRHTRSDRPDLPAHVNAEAIKDGTIALFDQVEKDGGHTEDVMIRLEGMAASAIATMLANTDPAERKEACKDVASRMVLNIVKLSVVILVRLAEDEVKKQAQADAETMQ